MGPLLAKDSDFGKHFVRVPTSAKSAISAMLTPRLAVASRKASNRSLQRVEMNQSEVCSMHQHVWLLPERMVEHFLARLFLRNAALRSLTLVSPFINTMADCRYSLADLSTKIKLQRTPTYVVTREPAESWQQEAVDLLAKNEWIEAVTVRVAGATTL